MQSLLAGTWHYKRSIAIVIKSCKYITDYILFLVMSMISTLAIYQLQAWKLNYIDVRSKVVKSVLEPSRAADRNEHRTGKSTEERVHSMIR